MTDQSGKSTGAENVRWNLSDLCPSEDHLVQSLVDNQGRATELRDKYKGRIADMSATELGEMFGQLAQLYDELGRAYTFAYLSWVTRTEDEAAGALLQKVKEAHVAATRELIFVEVEWAKVEAERAEGLLPDDALSKVRHYLKVLHENRDHVLTEPEEVILAEKSVTGRSAWNRYFDELVSAMRFTLDGRQLGQQEILTKLHLPDRDTRRSAAESFTVGLDENARTFAYVFNTLLADKATDDRLRKYDSWISSRNISNQVEDDAVDRLIDSVVSRYDLAHRFYSLKRELLGLGEMMDYDRYAPVGEADVFYSWGQAKEIVVDAYSTFSPTLGKIVTRFFDESWIDAPAVPGKRSGAFSHGAVPSVHPYILMNYTGRARDVQTLAHELGHGVHQFLAREQGVFHADTPLTTAETASVFGEMLTFQSLLAKQADPKNKLAMLVSKIDDSMATVFRQITMNRFEDAIHSHRRNKGELSVSDFSQHWISTQQQMFGDSVTLGDHYKMWWAYIPHFLHTPGYVYAYAFGELLVLALYSEYQRQGEQFSSKYTDLLAAGGSDYPHILVSKLGVDLNDPNFWQGGLKEIEKLILQAETLASDLKESATTD